MKNLQVRLIRFKRLPEEPEFVYALSESTQPVMGGYFYNRDAGRFLAVEHIMHESQLIKKLPVIEATDNEAYDLPGLPASLVKAFKESGDKILVTYLRLPEWEHQKATSPN